MLPDLSPTLQLNEKELFLYKRVRLLLVWLFIFFVIWFSFTLLFPVRHFQFDASIDSLANTISQPTLSETGTTFDVAHPFSVNRVLVEMRLAADASPLPDDAELHVTKSYKAFLSPLKPGARKATQSDDLPFPDGSLIASPSGIFVTSATERIPFDTELTLTASGYRFEDIREASSEERAAYSRGKIFSMPRPHPAGTRFYANDTDTHYLYTGEALHVTTAAGVTPITTQFASRQTTAQCTLKRHILRTHTYSCIFDLSPIIDFDGKRYTFTLKDLPNVAVDRIQLSFDTTPTPGALTDRITELHHLFTKNTTR